MLHHAHRLLEVHDLRTIDLYPVVYVPLNALKVSLENLDHAKPLLVSALRYNSSHHGFESIKA